MYTSVLPYMGLFLWKEFQGGVVKDLEFDGAHTITYDENLQ